VAGDRLLLVLFMLHPKPGYLLSHAPKVNKIGVYVLDFAQMMWEEVDDIGPLHLVCGLRREARRRVCGCGELWSRGEPSLHCGARRPCLEEGNPTRVGCIPQR
jgi:hypothetical protein